MTPAGREAPAALGSGSPPVGPAAPGADRTARLVAWTLAWLVAGLALRALQAWTSAGGVAEWEADGFALAWEGRPWDAWNRMRPPAFGPALHAAVDALGLVSVRAVRLLCVGASLLAWLAALDLVRALTGWSRAPSRRLALAACWLAGCWALFPTLVATAASPIPETLAGGSLCVALAALLRFRARPGVLRWLWAAAAGALALSLGGIVVAAALAVALVAYLVPVPRVGVGVPVLLLAVAAAAGGYLAQRGPDADRPWRPDGAPAYALSALVEAPQVLDDRELVDPDRRIAAVWASAWHELSQRGGLELAGALTHRLLVDQLSARRFEAVTSMPVLPLGLLDAFVRGGLVLFASATLAISRRSRVSAAPRAAAAAGMAALGLCTVSAAVGPFALGCFDLVLLALGVAGLAGADPARPGPRWIAFTIGGLMLSGVGLWALASGESPSPWARELTHRQGQGRALVGALRDGGPQDRTQHLMAAYQMIDPAAPLQRFPEAASRHANAALRLVPDDEAALRMVVQSEVECMRLEHAEELALSMLLPSGEVAFDNKVLLEWVQRKRRLLRGEGGS